MKALKKTFSVILCLCMIMSVMAAGLNAFAQEEATAALDGAVSEAAALAVSDPTDEKPDVDAMERTKVKYPIGASKKAVNRSIGRVEDILFTILKVPEGGVPKVLNEKVYTNETVALVAKKLFPLVGGLSSLVAKGPKDLAAKLDKETCAGAIAALNAAAATLGADGKPVGKLDAWQYLTVVDGDFGFANGDKEGFLDAVASLFRPLSLLTTVVSFENTTSLFYGPQLGIYEDLIPIFEALGIKDFMTSDEYTAYVKKGANTNEKMDRRIRGIITPIFTLVDAVASAESPVDEVLKLLPNLASAIDTGLIDTQIHSMLGKISLGIGNSVKVDLTTGGVYDILAPKLKDIELQAAKVDENGEETAPAVTLTINLDKEKFAAAIKDIAACGVFTAKESAAKTRNWFVGIEGDSADAFVVLFRYLHSELTEENNAVAIKTAVAALDMNASQKIVVNFLVSSVLSSSADGALRTIVALLPLAKTGVKIAARFGAFDK